MGSRKIISLLPCQASLFTKPKGIESFEVPTGARGQRHDLRKDEAVVIPGDEAGPSAFRLLCGKPFGFAAESEDPGRCFRKARRHPRAHSKLSHQKLIPNAKGGKPFYRLTIA